MLGRAFSEAYKQAAASSQYQRAQAKNGNATTSGRASLSSGMTLDEAKEALGGAGLNEKVTEKESATVPKGRVISTNPAKDAVLEVGKTVELVVSTGPPGGGNGDGGGSGKPTP